MEKKIKKFYNKSYYRKLNNDYGKSFKAHDYDLFLNLAKKNGWKINIAIFESPGALKYYASMDGTYPASEEISRLKGKTSAGLPFSTKELAQMAFNNDDKNEGIATIPDIALLPGGVPIILKNGYHLGGVGVSGSSGTNDEKCAFRAIEKGLEAIYE